jgi:hypothetical protein
MDHQTTQRLFDRLDTLNRNLGIIAAGVYALVAEMQKANALDPLAMLNEAISQPEPPTVVRSVVPDGDIPPEEAWRVGL